MIVKNGTTFLKLALIAGLVAVVGEGVANAQSGDSAAKLQVQLDALDTMTDTVGPMRSAATKRAELMKAFVTETKREDAWKTWSSEQKSPKFSGMTFDEAYKQAVAQQKSKGPQAPSTDEATLQREVEGQRELVQNEWNELNRAHETVSMMTAFLNSQNAMPEYVEWAKSSAAERAKTMDRPKATTDRQAEGKTLTPEQRAANIRKYQARQAHLRKYWDHYHFTFGTTGVPPGGPFRGNPQGGSTVGEDANLVGDPNPYIGGYPNAAVDSAYYQGDYWGGSWWNGYADPYYDVHGYPQIWNRGRVENAYRRATNANPNLSMRGAAARGMRGGGRR